MEIVQVEAIEVLDSRGNPTVEARVMLGDGVIASAMVPSGASTGEREAFEMRDNDKKRYNGKGVLRAVQNVNTKIAPEITQKYYQNQRELDYALIELDG